MAQDELLKPGLHTKGKITKEYLDAIERKIVEGLAIKMKLDLEAEKMFAEMYNKSLNN